MSDDSDSIVVAGDDAEILDQSADGAITCMEDGDGMAVSIDPNTELGERLAWHAGHRGESPEEYLRDAIREYTGESTDE